ncbi:putative long-chain-fatty-acid-CoA ligase [Emiliania huxleyi CCMP1516]|uniref:AMP-dependent synthetase/ligase domain-containing protein n=2 Tax=Emiliania huxleyi TaxID=2903 RepID=A0A0D3J7M6_EMIH1|nr:putative long-chain-fatty-acid-CoA ligase [Emiliania huxleyi CCMP1516]EOD19511.1 putative long-chain-fatty-acid-CoA ligase [Emiliania huxleyi CCMP1516]|eukprot:XP_005771940.1 putative long-chain-fatty-acid-CoA ligase [Emiliania huxleyi CCMP1516]
MHGLRETAAASSSVDPTSRLVRGGLSHVIGDTSEPLSELTVDGMFCETVRRTPDRLALSSPAQSIRYSWNELEEQVATAAAGLLSIGVGSGDRVGCWLPNVAEYVVMQLATSRIGAILTCLNPAYKLAELQHALRLAGVKALLFCPGGARSDHTAVVERLLQTAEEAAPCLERAVPSLERVIALSGGAGGPCSRAAASSLQHPMAMAYADVLEGGKRSRDQGLAAASLRGDGLEERSRAPAAAAALSHEDVTNIQFTSGTTGLPKAVGLTHRNIVNNGRFVARGMRLTSDDAVCLPVPLFHCFGLVLGSLACISTGAAIVFPSRTFDPRAALQAVQEERCSALYGVPTMFLAQLALSDFGSSNLPSASMLNVELVPPVKRVAPSFVTMMDRPYWAITVSVGAFATTTVS